MTKRMGEDITATKLWVPERNCWIITVLADQKEQKARPSVGETQKLAS